MIKFEKDEDFYHYFHRATKIYLEKKGCCVKVFQWMGKTYRLLIMVFLPFLFALGCGALVGSLMLSMFTSWVIMHTYLSIALTGVFVVAITLLCRHFLQLLQPNNYYEPPKIIDPFAPAPKEHGVTPLPSKECNSTVNSSILLAAEVEPKHSEVSEIMESSNNTASQA